MKQTDLGRIQELLTREIDCDRLKRGRMRQELVGKGESPDYAPLLMGYRTHSVPGLSQDISFVNAEHFLDGGSTVPEMADHAHFTFGEQIASPNLGLYEALWGVLSWARSPGDAQLAIRPTMVDALMSCFGMKRLVNDQGTPWYPEPLTLGEALDADVGDLEANDQVQLAVEHIHYYRENIVPGVHVSSPIAIGPFNYIDAMLGVSLYTELYDRPREIHALMAKITDVNTRLLMLYKKEVGEPVDSANIGPLFMARGGVKIGSDSMVMISPEMHRDFVQPYTVELCREFGGGYHHSCGFYPEQLKSLCEAEHVSTINLGQPELWDMGDAVTRIHQGGKIYYGGWVRSSDETLEDYLRRGVALCGPGRNRAILHVTSEDCDWPEPAETMDMWHRLQDEIFPA